MLTVREAMMVSADLKLGEDLNKEEKTEVVSSSRSYLQKHLQDLIVSIASR